MNCSWKPHERHRHETRHLETEKACRRMESHATAGGRTKKGGAFQWKGRTGRSRRAAVTRAKVWAAAVEMGVKAACEAEWWQRRLATMRHRHADLGQRIAGSNCSQSIFTTMWQIFRNLSSLMHVGTAAIRFERAVTERLMVGEGWARRRGVTFENSAWGDDGTMQATWCVWRRADRWVCGSRCRAGGKCATGRWRVMLA